ncbi:MAG: COX15/CtaA family protein [Pseudomonadota bacterium]
MATSLTAAAAPNDTAQRVVADDAVDRGRVWYRRLLGTALVLTLTVVVLGAWVRLTDAGLGCPDWPGCYGLIGVPETAEDIAVANAAYPERPVETGKAWREMIHRYAASTLGLVIVAMAVLAFRNRKDPTQPWRLPLALVAVVIFQGMLGMWTVTLLLKPLVVMGHLLGGMTTLGIIGWLAAMEWRRIPRPSIEFPRLRTLGMAALAALAVQIALGGWTSTNYAALACPDFPTCQTEWWPDMNFREGFVMWRGLGTDYEGGVLDNPSRAAIHYTHRLGALVVTALFAILIVAGWRTSSPAVRRATLLVGVALALQIVLGITIVLESLPLALATAHNGVAALLLLAVLNLNQSLRYVRDSVVPATR